VTLPAPPNQIRTEEISAELADWDREKPGRFWDPGAKLLLAMRRYQRWREGGGWASGLICKWLVLRHRFWSVVTGADIPLNARIGGGLLIPHPNGIVIHPDARIGVNCLIFQQVTIGSDGSGVPEIGGHVDIGAGAKILGAVRIGAHAKIGANAVVLKDVPPRSTAIGIPACNVGS
jgi:serine O-acetyltransferase